MGTGLELLPVSAEALTAAEFAANAGAATAFSSVAPGAAIAAAPAAASGFGAVAKEALPFVQAASGVANLTTALSAKPSAPGLAAPAVSPVATAPAPFTQNTEASAARRASIAEQLRRQGRASTILTGDQTTDRLGG